MTALQTPPPPPLCPIRPSSRSTSSFTAEGSAITGCCASSWAIHLRNTKLQVEPFEQHRVWVCLVYAVIEIACVGVGDGDCDGDGDGEGEGEGDGGGGGEGDGGGGGGGGDGDGEKGWE